MSQCNDWPIINPGTTTWATTGLIPVVWSDQGLNPSSWTIIQKVNLTWGIGRRLLWGECRFLVWLQN